MRNKPKEGRKHVVFTVRLPVKLLLRFARWLLVAGSAYALLHR